jgi:hypothetical protein
MLVIRILADVHCRICEGRRVNCGFLLLPFGRPFFEYYPRP